MMTHSMFFHISDDKEKEEEDSGGGLVLSSCKNVSGSENESKNGNGDKVLASEREESHSESEDEKKPGKTKESGSDDDEGELYTDGGDDEVEAKKMFQRLNRELLDIYICKTISDGNQIYYIVCFGELRWYNTVIAFKA